jgi:hypothetical protein
VRVNARSSLERAGLERIATAAGLVVAARDGSAPIGLHSGELSVEGSRGDGAAAHAVATVIVKADEVVVRLRQPVEPAALDDVIALVRAATART